MMKNTIESIPSPTGRSRITKVEIKWSENEAIDCFAGVYNRLVDASAAISVALGIKPEPIDYGVYEITSLEVTFSDGFIFEGRFDAARRLAENRPLFPITVAT